MLDPTARPPVSDLVLRVYDRPIHPELFDALAVRCVRRPGCVLTVRLTPTGHVLEFSGRDSHLVEVTAAAGQELPDGGRLAHRFGAERRGRVPVGAWGRYEVCSHAEVLPPDVFVHAHDELAADGVRRGLVSRLPPRHRLGLAPLGVVVVDVLPTGLAVAAFHTFPDEFAVVKTVSLIEPG